ncbi:hypothetical protein VTI74DRAFT_11291 [Chaetomium olivicolor]
MESNETSSRENTPRHPHTLLRAANHDVPLQTGHTCRVRAKWPTNRHMHGLETIGPVTDELDASPLTSSRSIA